MKTNPTILPDRRVIGLDLHPDTFTAAALRGPEAASASVEWIHDRRSVEQLERWASEHVHARDVIVLEASGNSFDAVERLQQLDRAVVVLESARAGPIRKAYCVTDKVSAVKLARVYLSGLAVTVWTPDDKTRARRELDHSHRRAVKDTTQGRNRIRSWLNSHGLKAPKGLRLTQASGRDWVLKARAWSELQRLLVEQMFSDLHQAEARRKELRRLMAPEIVQDKERLRLVRLFGLRHITVFALGACIGDIRRFRTPKQLVAYVGLNPSVNRSGKGGWEGALQGNGRSDLRALLIQSGQVLLRHENPLKKWGWKLAMRKGKKGRNCAAVAVARKLVVACWYRMQGLFTPLEEVTDKLRLQIGQWILAVGEKKIKALGHKTRKDFEEFLCKEIMAT
jgi:transposase